MESASRPGSSPPLPGEPGAYAAEHSRLEAAPGLARIAAGAWLRTAAFAAGASLRATNRVGRAILTGESPGNLVRDAAEETIEIARRVLGPEEVDRIADRAVGMRSEEEPAPLRSRGAKLLEESADLDAHKEEHPAYARILEQLSPDEARILRLLATRGPQPAVDIRTWRPLDIGSRVTAPGLTMIGRQAGVRHHDRVPPYLSNLFRLGLIWFSRDDLPDPAPYQVLEAQPEVIEAIRRTGRARVVRRSIQLTPFGGHFCHHCLPLDPGEITGEFAALEPHILESAGRPGSAPSVTLD